MYSRIIVPLDGSEVAEAALSDATKLSRLTQAPVFLVHVVGFPQPSAGGLGISDLQQMALADLVEQDTRKAEEYLDNVKTRLEGEGIQVSTQIRQGQVTASLLHGTEPGDVMVMSTHGRGGLRRWFLGSVAEEVVRKASIPVLLVRVPES